MMYKRTTKRLLAGLLIVGILLALAACGGDDGGYRQVYPPAAEGQTEDAAPETKSVPADTTVAAETEKAAQTPAHQTEAPEESSAPNTEATTQTEAPAETSALETDAPPTNPPAETAAPTETTAAAETSEPEPEESTEPAAETEEAGDRAHVHGADAPTETADAVITYVLNKNTKKFHLPSCSSVEEIKPENRWDFMGTREEVLKMDYVPCKRCKP